MVASDRFKINRAPVLTLWAAVVAERLGFDHDEALTLGRAVAGLNAYSKGKRLGLFKPSSESLKEKRAEPAEGFEVELLHRAVPVVNTPDGIRATAKGKPTSPASVEKYLAANLVTTSSRRRGPWPPSRSHTGRWSCRTLASSSTGLPAECPPGRRGMGGRTGCSIWRRYGG